MKITIDVMETGAIVSIPVGCNNDYKQKKVYKFDYDTHKDIDDYINMLYDITEAIFLFGKYSQERIEIKKIHGEGHVCNNEKCGICHNAEK
mgnify:FL=1